MTLARLGEREKVLPVFDYTYDPEALTQFIFRCRERGVGAEPLLELLDIETLTNSTMLAQRVLVYFYFKIFERA